MAAATRDERPILVVHPDRKTQRTLHRILGGTFRPVVLADDLAAAEARLGDGPPFLVVIDHQLVLAEAGRRIFGGRDTPCLVLLQDAEPEELASVLGLGSLSYLLANPMPLLAEELSVTVHKLLRRQIFGLEKYLTWGIEVRQRSLDDADQRRALVDDLAADVHGAGLGPRVLAAATLIADELLSNALFNAPVDDSGTRHHQDDARGASRQLDGRDQVTLRYACDARYLAIEVEDRFGSLDRRTILRCLSKATGRAPDKVSMQTRGAGIGLATVYGSCNHLVFNLEPGQRTQVIALIDVRFRPAELINAVCSFGIFSTEERRS